MSNPNQPPKQGKNPLNFPGVTPPPSDLPEFTPEHQDAFRNMQEQCYNSLHRPRVIKIMNWPDALYYVCQECLEAYLEKYPELKETVLSFGR